MSQSQTSLEYIEEMSLDLLKAIRTFREERRMEMNRQETKIEPSQCQFTEERRNKGSDLCDQKSSQTDTGDKHNTDTGDRNDPKQQGDVECVRHEPNILLEENLRKMQNIGETELNFIRFVRSLVEEENPLEHKNSGPEKSESSTLKRENSLHQMKLEDSKKLEQLEFMNHQTKMQCEELEAEVFCLKGQIQARDIIIKDFEKTVTNYQIDCDEKHAQILHLQDTYNHSLKYAIVNKVQFLIAEEMQCAICTDFLKKAVTLGCSHTFCEECLSGLAEQQCPMCRQIIQLRIPTPVIDSLMQKLAESYPECKLK